MLPTLAVRRRQLFARTCVWRQLLQIKTIRMEQMQEMAEIMIMQIYSQLISAQVILRGQSVHQEAITKRNVSVSWLISAQLTPPELSARATTRTSAHVKTSSAKAGLTTPASMAMTSRHAPVRSLVEER
jgi:hypothetical protein